MTELPDNWERATDIEEHKDTIGFEVYRSIQNPALLVSMEDDIGMTEVRATFETGDTSEEILKDACSDHHTACRRVREYMDALNSMDQAFVDTYGLEEDNAE